MSADVLRRAAALMRERAEAAPAGTWFTMRYGRVAHPIVAGSQIADMVADTYPTGESAAQQATGRGVVVGRRSKTLGPADRTRLLHAAHLISALPILAIVTPRQPLRYWHVTEDTARHWNEWQPVSPTSTKGASA